MYAALLREKVQSRDFALADLCIVVFSGAILCLAPELGAWPLVLALIPWGFRFVAELPLFRRSSFDWLIAIFVISAGAGYWASYDGTIALNKLMLIVISALLYYSLRSQPVENLIWVSGMLFCLGVGISIYFFLTHDFVTLPRKLEIVNVIGRWLMKVRPAFDWSPVHPNYVSGFAAVTTPFIYYPIWKLQKSKSLNPRHYLLIALGLVIVLSAMLMATSRGVLMAIASAAGIWLMWRVARLRRIRLWLDSEAAFPPLVMIFLLVVIILLYAGPAQIGGSTSEAYYFGDGSRGELFARSLLLSSDFPFTGGGLGAFPALYSHYMLGIPNYNVPNSHNMFLDVFIEQGAFGGSAFLLLYLAGIWRASRNITRAGSQSGKLFNWVVLLSLVIAFAHGMVDDYLYNGSGTILSVALLGIIPEQFETQPKFEGAKRRDRTDIIILASIAALLVGLILISGNTIRSIWYSNLGAVQMARVELAGFPTNQWAEPAIVEKLQDAKMSLLASIEADPANRTANHRLGLIALLRQDFPSAEVYLSNAYRLTPSHRGIIKSLGYCYTWIGELENAKSLLEGIPEASSELNVYAWWWQAQGRSDTSNYASLMRSRLISSPSQP